MAGPTAKKSKKDIKALIASAKLPERTVPVCLNADLSAELQELERQLEVSEQQRRAGEGSLASGSESRVLAGQIEAVREQMLDTTVVFRLRAMPRRRFRKMQDDFPPREGNSIDAMSGVDTEGMTEPLVRACVVEPELDDEDWSNLLDEETGRLSEGQWTVLANAAWAINARDANVPFSRTASRILQGPEDD